MKLLWTAGLGLLLASSLALGCGKFGSAPTARVTGTVKSGGQPLENVVVNFLPKEGRPGLGKTDASGRFTITTFAAGDGAVPGAHKVLLNEEAEKGPIPMPGTPGYAEAMAKKKPPRVPAKYSDPAKTPLEATVTVGGKNDFDFEVKKD